MIYSALAAIVALFHGLLVAVLFIGLFFALANKLKQWPVFERIYLSFAVSMIVSYVFTGGCYLTDIEQRLWRKAHSPLSYSGGCISHYLRFIGIKVADDSVYWTLVYSLILGLGSYVLRYCLAKLQDINKRG
ncbi:MAG: DUF2784 family protein [Actinomycetota bacterium]|nr:DUF2784 family protein [Actinomycetota bacterium]